jgi:chromosome segregation ATPase
MSFELWGALAVATTTSIIAIYTAQAQRRKLEADGDSTAAQGHKAIVDGAVAMVNVANEENARMRGEIARLGKRLDDLETRLQTERQAFDRMHRENRKLRDRLTELETRLELPHIDPDNPDD